jgi:hypothetical protein
MGKRVAIGDIFQILTTECICYGQVLHKHAKWGFVVGVFYDFPDRRPDDFTGYVNRVPDYVTTFLINHAVSQGLFTVVGNVPVAPCNATFPTFRNANNPSHGDATIWFLWDGEREWRANGPLTEEQRRYPRGPSLPSAPLFVEMIQKQYRVERDFI